MPATQDPAKKSKYGQNHKRYRQKRCKTVASVPLVADEARWLRAAKRALGLSWRDIIYRGLGRKREEYLASRRARAQELPK